MLIKVCRILRCTLLFVFGIINTQLSGQSFIDSLGQEFKVCVDSGDTTCIEKLVMTLSEIQVDSQRYNLAIQTGNWLLNKRGPDAAFKIFQKTAELFDNEATPAQKGRIAERMGACNLYKADYDEAYKHYNNQLNFAQSEFSVENIGRAQVNLATVLRAKGDFDKAALMYQEALTTFEGTTPYNMGFPNMQLGVLFGMQEQYDRSIEYFQKAVYYLRQTDRTSILGVACVNYGNTLLSDGQVDSARVYLSEASQIFESINDNRSLVNAKTQLARSYLNEGDLEKGERLVLELMPIIKKQNLRNQEAYNYKLLAELSFSEGYLNKALKYAEASISAHKLIGVNEESADVLSLLSDIHEKRKDFKSALDYNKQAETIEDSLFVKEKTLELENLEAKYQGERKSKEIEILKKDKALDQLKRTRIIFFGLAIIILLISIFSFFFLRAKQKQRLLSLERDQEISKRELVIQRNEILEKDNIIKQNELVSNALIISKKNQVLEKVKLSLSEDDLQNKSKLLRMIDGELEGQADWEKFLDSFREANPNVISKFVSRYPELSKTDVRLICLMRMNLTTKEIASILNVTTEGIKKAKYRLRKKMDLTPETDTQKFIASF